MPITPLTVEFDKGGLPWFHSFDIGVDRVWLIHSNHSIK